MTEWNPDLTASSGEVVLPALVPLSKAPAGSTVRLKKTVAGEGMEKRLNDLGLSVDEPLVVVKNDGRGPLVVRVRKSSYALGRSLCEKLLMEVEVGR